jgi:hypothetical protein
VEIKQPKHEFPVRRVALEVGGGDLYRSGTATMHWLDNDRLAVLGLVWVVPPRPFKVNDPDPLPRYDTYLYIWDIRKPHPHQIMKVPGPTPDLFGDGSALRIFFRREGEKRSEILEGTIVEDRFEGKSMTFPGEPGDFVANRFTGALSRAAEKPTAMPGPRVIQPLRPEHGFLDLGGDDDARWTAPEKDPVRWYPAEGGSLRELHFWVRNPRAAEIAFSRYSGEYMVAELAPSSEKPGRVSSWPKGEPQKLHLWKPHANARLLTVPYGNYTPIWHALPSRAGLIIVSTYAQIDKTASGAGVYLFNGNVSRHLAAGTPNAYALSPDGCRLAVGLQTTEGRVLQPWRLHLIDLCLGGK